MTRFRYHWNELPSWQLPPGVSQPARRAPVPGNIRRAYGPTPRDLDVDMLWGWYVATHDRFRTVQAERQKEQDALKQTTARAEHLATILGQVIDVTNAPALTGEALAGLANKFRTADDTRRATLDQIARLVGMPSAGAPSDLDRLVDYVRNRCEKAKALDEARDRLGVSHFTPGTVADQVLGAIDEGKMERRRDTARIAELENLIADQIDRTTAYSDAFNRACDVIDMAARPSVTETLRAFVDAKLEAINDGAAS